MVKGIGFVYAKKLVEKFGERIFDIIEQESARLEDIDGIGPKRRQRIKEAWAEQKVTCSALCHLAPACCSLTANSRQKLADLLC
jgi:5'-3' exonuclease